MTESSIRYICYPRTKPPPAFAAKVIAVFRRYEEQIGTVHLDKGLTSDQVLARMRGDLVSLGFDVERGKRKDEKIERPVFFGEGGEATLRYEVDAYHPKWHCGLEVEAGRAVMGNAIYRDLVQALVMVQVDVLILAVPNEYKYKSSGRLAISRDYEKTASVVETIYSHARFQLPYDLVLVGY
jgi:hypothetical protein